jgi:GDPmannose 4,6-dehydratase
MSNTIVCVTGTTGQGGSYLCELLLNKGYIVYGLKRRTSTLNTERIDHIFNHPNFHLVYGDAVDYSSLLNFVGDIKPHYFYNLMAQSHVKTSFEVPESTFDMTGASVLRCLEAIRKGSPKTKFLTSSSSEQFGSSAAPQNEQTIMHPRSPYSVAKLAGYWATINYREAYNLFACNSICFNFESPRRLETFVTRKITKGLSRIKLGLQDKLYLGQLDSRRDWTHCSDSIRAMNMILESDHADDYVVGTGETRSVRQFLDVVSEKLNLDWKEYVVIDPKYFRPSEVEVLQADSTKIRTKLGWEPQVSFDQLVTEMVSHDLKLAQQEFMQKQLQNLPFKIDSITQDFASYKPINNSVDKQRTVDFRGVQIQDSNKFLSINSDIK